MHERSSPHPGLLDGEREREAPGPAWHMFLMNSRQGFDLIRARLEPGAT